MTPKKVEDEIILTRIETFLSEHIEYTKQNNLEVYPPWYICKYRDHLISEAMLGDPYRRDILCDFANALTADSKPLPLWLQEYVVFAARHNGHGSHRKRGRDPYVNRHRNDRIATAVNLLADDGFCPTRNTVTTTECGCSIVAKALERIGIHMSEANVAAIWRADSVLAQAYSSERKKQSEGRKQREDGAGCHCTPGDCERLADFELPL